MTAVAVVAGAIGALSSTAASASPSRVDVGFSQAMAVHHQQAITLAQLVEDQPDPTVRGLARSIETNQTEQLGQLEGWLALWGQPIDPAQRPTAWMPPVADHPPGAQVPVGMPGTVSTADMARLQHLNGTAREALFLQLMIRHHRGGIAMADYARNHAALRPVRDLATRMVMDEEIEIQRMTVVLTTHP